MDPALKRYGFVELSDGSGDAFLHASAVVGVSIGALQPGVTIEFRTAPAQRGLQVTEVIGIDASAGRHNGFERGATRLRRRSRGAKRTRSRLNPSGELRERHARSIRPLVRHRQRSVNENSG